MVMRAAKKKQTSSGITSHNGNGHRQNGTHKNSNGRIPHDAVSLWRKGDLSTVPRVRKALCDTIHRFSGNPDLAEEVAQETLMTVLCGEDEASMNTTFRPGSDSSPWLIAIAINKAKDSMRREKRHRTVSYDRAIKLEGGDSFIALYQDEGSEKDMAAKHAREDAIKRGAKEVLDYLIREMNNGGRSSGTLKVFYLTEVLDKTYEVAARLAPCLIGTVKSRAHYGKEKLRVEFGHLEKLINPRGPKPKSSIRSPRYNGQGPKLQQYHQTSPATPTRLQPPSFVAPTRPYSSSHTNSSS